MLLLIYLWVIQVLFFYIFSRWVRLWPFLYPFPRPSSQIWPDSQKGKRRRTFGKQQATREEGHECCSNTTFPRKKKFLKKSHFINTNTFLVKRMCVSSCGAQWTLTFWAAIHRFALSKKFKVATFGAKGKGGVGRVGGTWKHPTEFGSRAKHPWKRNIQNWEKGKRLKGRRPPPRQRKKASTCCKTAVCFSKALVQKLFRVQEKMLLFYLYKREAILKSFPPFPSKKRFFRGRREFAAELKKSFRNRSSSTSDFWRLYVQYFFLKQQPVNPEEEKNGRKEAFSAAVSTPNPFFPSISSRIRNKKKKCT